MAQQSPFPDGLNTSPLNLVLLHLFASNALPRISPVHLTWLTLGLKGTWPLSTDGDTKLPKNPLNKSHVVPRMSKRGAVVVDPLNPVSTSPEFMLRQQVLSSLHSAPRASDIVLPKARPKQEQDIAAPLLVAPFAPRESVAPQRLSPQSIPQLPKGIAVPFSERPAIPTSISPLIPQEIVQKINQAHPIFLRGSNVHGLLKDVERTINAFYDIMGRDPASGALLAKEVKRSLNELRGAAASALRHTIAYEGWLKHRAHKWNLKNLSEEQLALLYRLDEEMMNKRKGNKDIYYILKEIYDNENPERAEVMLRTYAMRFGGKFGLPKFEIDEVVRRIWDRITSNPEEMRILYEKEKEAREEFAEAIRKPEGRKKK